MESLTVGTKSEMSSYDINHEAIIELKRPNIDPFADLKTRVTLLENNVTFESKINVLTVSMLDDLNLIIFNLENKLMKQMAINQQKLTTEVDELKQNYDHRFDLQTAENTRSIQHISTLKNENNQLRRKLEITAKKLQRLQSEFDGGETAEDIDDSVLYSSSDKSQIVNDVSYINDRTTSS